MAIPKDDMLLNFTDLTKGEAELLLAGLAARQYAEVHGLMNKLQKQIQVQVLLANASVAAPVAAPVDSPEVPPPAA